MIQTLANKHVSMALKLRGASDALIDQSYVINLNELA